MWNCLVPVLMRPFFPFLLNYIKTTSVCVIVHDLVSDCIWWLLWGRRTWRIYTTCSNQKVLVFWWTVGFVRGNRTALPCKASYHKVLMYVLSLVWCETKGYSWLSMRKNSSYRSSEPGQEVLCWLYKDRKITRGVHVKSGACDEISHEGRRRTIWHL